MHIFLVIMMWTLMLNLPVCPSVTGWCDPAPQHSWHPHSGQCPAPSGQAGDPEHDEDGPREVLSTSEYPCHPFSSPSLDPSLPHILPSPSSLTISPSVSSPSLPLSLPQVSLQLLEVVDVVLFCLDQDQVKKKNLLDLFPVIAK